MVLEYNGNFGPERSLAIARETDMSRAVKGFHGASLKALTKLAAAKGYKLSPATRVAPMPSSCETISLRASRRSRQR